MSAVSRGLSALLLAMPLLAACSDGRAPSGVQAVPPAEVVRELGGLRVHFNALPTLALSEPMAREYALQRDAASALVVVALRARRDGDEVPAQGQVSGQAIDLSGRRQPIAFRPVRTGDYVDYIGTVQISGQDSLRFELQVRADEGSGPLSFQRSF